MDGWMDGWMDGCKMVGYLSGIWVDVGPCYDDWLVVGGISDVSWFLCGCNGEYFS